MFTYCPDLHKRLIHVLKCEQLFIKLGPQGLARPTCEAYEIQASKQYNTKGKCSYYVHILVSNTLTMIFHILPSIDILHTEGSCLMLLMGPGKKPHQPKIALAKFLFYVRSNKIFSPKNRISQILVIVLKNRSNEIRIRQELPVIIVQLQKLFSLIAQHLVAVGNIFKMCCQIKIVVLFK